MFGSAKCSRASMMTHYQKKKKKTHGVRMKILSQGWCGGVINPQGKNFRSGPGGSGFLRHNPNLCLFSQFVSIKFLGMYRAKAHTIDYWNIQSRYGCLMMGL